MQRSLSRPNFAYQLSVQHRVMLVLSCLGLFYLIFNYWQETNPYIVLNPGSSSSSVASSSLHDDGHHSVPTKHKHDQFFVASHTSTNPRSRITTRFSDDLTILNYNLWNYMFEWHTRLQYIADTIILTDPDVITLQEIYSIPIHNTITNENENSAQGQTQSQFESESEIQANRREKKQKAQQEEEHHVNDQLHYLLKLINKGTHKPYEYWIFLPSLDKDDNSKLDSISPIEGIAILSKYQLTNIQNYRFDMNKNNVNININNGVDENPRVFLKTSLVIPYLDNNNNNNKNEKLANGDSFHSYNGYLIDIYLLHLTYDKSLQCSHISQLLHYMSDHSIGYGARDAKHIFIIGDLNIFNNFNAPVELLKSNGQSTQSCNGFKDENKDRLIESFDNNNIHWIDVFETNNNNKNKENNNNEADQSQILTFSNMPYPGMISRPDRIFMTYSNSKSQENAQIVALQNIEDSNNNNNKIIDLANPSQGVKTKSSKMAFLTIVETNVIGDGSDYGRYSLYYYLRMVFERITYILDGKKCEIDCGPNGYCSCGVCVKQPNGIPDEIKHCYDLDNIDSGGDNDNDNGGGGGKKSSSSKFGELLIESPYYKSHTLPIFDILDLKGRHRRYQSHCAHCRVISIYFLIYVITIILCALYLVYVYGIPPRVRLNFPRVCAENFKRFEKRKEEFAARRSNLNHLAKFKHVFSDSMYNVLTKTRKFQTHISNNYLKDSMLYKDSNQNSKSNVKSNFKNSNKNTNKHKNKSKNSNETSDIASSKTGNNTENTKIINNHHKRRQSDTIFEDDVSLGSLNSLNSFNDSRRGGNVVVDTTEPVMMTHDENKADDKKFGHYQRNRPTQSQQQQQQQLQESMVSVNNDAIPETPKLRGKRHGWSKRGLKKHMLMDRTVNTCHLVICLVLLIIFCMIIGMLMESIIIATNMLDEEYFPSDHRGLLAKFKINF